MAARSALSFDEVAAKYPQFPRLILLKTDIQRRGVYYTEAALSQVDPARHQLGGTHLFGARDGKLTNRPEACVLRDGTTALTSPAPLENDPYIVDYLEERLVLTDRGKIIEDVYYWDKPDFYDKKTSRGVLMQNVISARPQRLYVMANRYCHFWADGGGCRFCDVVNNLKAQRSELEMQTKIRPEDVSETMREALKEPGRFTAVCVTSGSDFHGEKPFDKEVEYYIEILKALGEHIAVKKFPCQLICSALSKEQLRRLYDETGVTSVTMDLEVLDERLFGIICPGKAKWVGYQKWKKSLIGAVDIFGPGRVNTAVVSGVELLAPFGFTSEDEALDAILGEAEDLARHGVGTVLAIWIPRPGAPLGGEKNASLEYYARLILGLKDLRNKYGLSIDFDDYRRCGNHPDSDLARAL
jgi:hypothetical protein